MNSLDYLLLFKKYIAKEESSYKLGDLGEKYVNLGKISYGRLNLNTNYLKQDFQTHLLEYNSEMLILLRH